MRQAQDGRGLAPCLAALILDVPMENRDLLRETAHKYWLARRQIVKMPWKDR